MQVYSVEWSFDAQDDLECIADEIEGLLKMLLFWMLQH